MSLEDYKKRKSLKEKDEKGIRDSIKIKRKINRGGRRTKLLRERAYVVIKSKTGTIENYKEKIKELNRMNRELNKIKNIL